MVANRDKVAPGARIVFGGISAEEAARLELPADVVGALTEFDVGRTFGLARDLQPDARNVVVMAGSTPFDKAWLKAARRDLAGVGSDYRVSYVTDLSLEEFAARATALPKNTILIILTILKDFDRQGLGAARCRRQDRGRRLGPGLWTLFDLCRQRHRRQQHLHLRGDRRGGRRSRPRGAARQPHRQRHGAAELSCRCPAACPRGLLQARLPPGTRLSFAEPTLWQQHRTSILVTFAIVLIQALIISALLVERRRRATAELEARRRLLQVVHLNQSATAGALSASIAHELNQPLGAIRTTPRPPRSSCGARAGHAARPADPRRHPRDDQRASEIIQRLRGMLKKRSEIEWQEFDINEVVDSAVQLLHGEAERRRVLIDRTSRSASCGCKRRPRAPAAGRPQPRHQCHGRDAGLGAGATPAAAQDHPLRRLQGCGLGVRHRDRHSERPARPGLRDLLHHQDHRHRPWPVDRPSDRRDLWRAHLGRQPAGRRRRGRLRSAAGEDVKAPPPTLHIIDDDASFRRSLGRLLEALGYCVRFYPSGVAFLAAPPQPGPGCILLDLEMPGESGLTVQAQLAEAAPLLPVIFLSGHGDIQRTVLAIKGGAEDFLEKTGPTQLLLAAVARALERYRDRLADHVRTDELRTLVASLTPRETTVFEHIVRGRRNKEVAFVLGTSERTVKAHRKSIMEKLQVGSLAEAVSVAERLGLLTGDGPPALDAAPVGPAATGTAGA